MMATRTMATRMMAPKMMATKIKLGVFLLAAILQFSLCALAQQTLGGITGTVSDKSGSVLPDTTVTIVGDQTKLTRSQKTNGNGAYDFVNLPIGTYTVTVSHDGFQTERLASILVQADRTATLNVSLKVGQVGTTIDVEAAPDHERGRHHQRICAGRAADSGGAATDGQLHRAGDSFSRRERGTARRHRRKPGAWQSADLGQRTARHQQHFSSERRGRQQPVQRQEHQFGGFGPRGE